MIRRAVRLVLAAALCTGSCGDSSPSSTETPTAPVSPTLTRVSSGLTGHLGSGISSAGSDGFGFSYYSMIGPLQSVVTEGTQLGWGTWVVPENLGFSQPLCPVGTYARDHWPERGPTYRDVYQTLEGGAGLWVSTHFPAPLPKFRVNTTPDCYSHEVASTGWTFYGDRLGTPQLGIAQLSNRLLSPPDGLVFDAPEPALLGYGWFALPLIPAGTSALGVETGDESWALLLRTENFVGAVSFFTPELWSAVNANDATGVGRGLDARPGFMGSVALEIGITPALETRDSAGATYRRVPRLDFASDDQGRATLLQDVTYYSKAALWDGTAAWLDGSASTIALDPAGASEPDLAGTFVGLSMDGSQVSIASALFTPTTFTTIGGGTALGMEWGDGLTAGVIPEYYKKVGGIWVAVTESQAPSWLSADSATFPPLDRRSFPDVDISSGGPWDASDWSAGPFTAHLADGSTVDYVWYRFVDQPAIARLGLDATTLQKLQTLAEAVHDGGALAEVSFAPPTSGSLVAIDASLLVTPPAGLESGYVPIVIRQH